MRRRTLHIYLSLLAAFLLGTVIVLSSISYYLAIDNSAFLTEDELGVPDYYSRWNATQHGKVERVPRIIHQTWKTETLPSEWIEISEACREMMPDYEYMLWTDEGSRVFLEEHYPWFVDTFEAYPYNIQRADVIRYFVLHHFGGVYIDLDIGCLRPLDPLLVYPIILPKTIPVGVSNDLMFAERRHPFMAQTINNLITFDHSWILNYPTVMFSTGPMFLSAQYGLYAASHPTPPESRSEVRILPKALYGKNANIEDAPHPFFSHYYGSSWHADDAAFIGFLSKWGKILMVVGLIILIFGLIRLVIPSSKRRRIGGYEVVLPNWTQRNGRWYLDLGWFALPSSDSNSQSLSPTDISISNGELPLLPLQIDTRSSTSRPSSELPSLGEVFSAPLSNTVTDATRRFGARVKSLFGSGDYSIVPHSPHLRRSRPRGVLYFLPAIFNTAPRDIIDSSPQTHRTGTFHSHDLPIPPLLPEKDARNEDSDVPDISSVSGSRGRRSANLSVDDPFSDDVTSGWGS